MADTTPPPGSEGDDQSTLEKIANGKADVASVTGDQPTPPVFALKLAKGQIKGPYDKAGKYSKAYVVWGEAEWGKGDTQTMRPQVALVSAVGLDAKHPAKRTTVALAKFSITEARLESLPLVGDVVNGEFTSALLVVTTIPALDKDVRESVNALIEGECATCPSVPAAKEGQAWGAGAYLAVEYKLFGKEMDPLELRLLKRKPAAQKDDVQAGQDPPKAPVAQRGGRLSAAVMYLPAVPKEKNPAGKDVPDALRLAVDGTVSLHGGGLEVGLIGAGLTVPLSKNLKPADILPPLEGLSVSWSNPAKPDALRIAGALLWDAEAWRQGFFKLDGMLALTTPSLALNLSGSYARITPVNGTAFDSFFVFLSANGFKVPLGPVTLQGFMLGGGMNSTVRLPPVDQVSTFPFLTHLDSGSVDGATKPHEVLRKLCGTGDADRWVTPKPGQHWVAAGLDLAFAEAVQGRLLGLVEFGDELSVALMGLLSLEAPRSKAKSGGAVAPRGDEEKPKPLTRVELQILVQYVRAQGLFAAACALTDDSYLLAEECKLTGGAALYWWTAGQHAGDVVFTAGGYSPAFKPPDHYPQVPRIGLIWDTWGLVYRGEFYFARTPRALMMGGALAVTQDRGWWRWWLDAHIDAWGEWDPIFVRADVGVSAGVAATIRVGPIKVKVSAEIAVQYSAWWVENSEGRTLHGGSWAVHLWAIDFDGSYGTPYPQDRPKVGWKDFQRQIPSPLKVANKVSTPMAGEPQAGRGQDVYATSGFSFDTDASGPITHLRVNGKVWEGQDPEKDKIPDDAGTWDLALMGNEGAGRTSRHSLEIRKDGRPDYDVPREQYWQITKVTSNRPTALYQRHTGQRLPLNTPRQQENAFTGVRVTAPAPRPSKQHLVADEADLTTTPIELEGGQRILPPKATTPCGPPARRGDATTRATVAKSLAETAAARRNLARDLAGLGVEVPEQDAGLTAFPGFLLKSWTEPPLLLADA
ncbi:DUF6603 domain-containing protein [Streptomyces huiliensis]|uniref:DUF6603 domain-containing protein n=1 Tax=Streptomyces huiliensis TaxID=2876027 RepID=UPI001CBCFDD4|nr:DUF6603 domain-containing protein [Streptomyces huiliensis]MBZ4319456.1 hypothetical protein [Streptomyces huiliensis]